MRNGTLVRFGQVARDPRLGARRLGVPPQPRRRLVGPAIRRLWPVTVTAAIGVVFAVAVATVAGQQPAATAAGFPSAADVESYRSTVEKVFMTDRGGTIPGYAACVMCHTWQTSVRFSLATPATDPRRIAKTRNNPDNRLTKSTVLGLLSLRQTEAVNDWTNDRHQG